MIQDCASIAVTLGPVDEGAYVDALWCVADPGAYRDCYVIWKAKIEINERFGEGVTIATLETGVQGLVDVVGEGGAVPEVQEYSLADGPGAAHPADDAVQDCLHVAAEAP